jgi:hypothetical protein
MNKQLREMRQQEIEQQRIAEAQRNLAEQIRIENERQKVALLTLSVDVMKQDGGVWTAEKLVETAKVLEGFVKG